MKRLFARSATVMFAGTLILLVVQSIPGGTSASGTASAGFSAEEKAAARERVRELKAEAAGTVGGANGRALP